MRAGQHYYQCTSQSSRYGYAPCLSIPGRGLDVAVERLFLRVVDSPPMSALEEALNDARVEERIRAERVEHEHKRLLSLERRAKERFDDANHHFTFAWEYAQKELNDAIQARRLFEQHLASEPAPQNLPNKADLHELRRTATDVPALWRDPEVTNPERNAMLASVIDRIRVSRTDEFIQMDVQWAGGLVTPLHIHRRRGIEQLVRALHQQGMTVAEIRERLGEGDAETGERWNYTAGGIYQILKRLGLQPNRPRPRGSLLAKINQLYDEGVTLDGIASTLNGDGHRTARGNAWNANAVWHWLGRRGRRDDLEAIHRQALAEAKARGLSNAQTAEEFNAKGIPRVGCKSWTDDAVRQRRSQLARRDRRVAKLDVRNGTTDDASKESP
jgi:hypothetical protein